MVLRLFAFIVLVSQIAGDCSLEPAIKDDGPSVGVIFVPGAKIAGEAYLPLLRVIQEMYPGSLWIAATTTWLNDMPNPIEIGGQINDCLDQAKALGLDTSTVYFGGHSLGGIVLESYINGHAELAQGIFLLGTWLPDLLRATNEFPVPVLTAIGELDGGGISYLRREWEETQDLTQEKQLLTKTILVPQVNHGQVASGEVPESVVDNDIDAELTEAEAHANYAARVANWLTLNTGFRSGLSARNTAFRSALASFEEYEEATEEFLRPFLLMHRQEQTHPGTETPFAETAQTALLKAPLEVELKVSNDIVDAITFQVNQPSLRNQDGSIAVNTFAHLQYDLDVLDFNNHLSASTMKIKLKSADAIYEAAGLPLSGEFTSCAAINQKSLELAASVASPTALLRLEAKGRKLYVVEDLQMSWVGVPWELDDGLVWTENEYRTVTLQSSRLTSDVDFPLFSGLQYCDVLSPYRALEWIYIESLRHVMHL